MRAPFEMVLDQLCLLLQLHDIMPFEGGRRWSDGV
jgi:hypothetical protein